MSLDRLEIEGTFNFRDLGGPATEAGDHRVRSGKVFRADGLAQLSDRARADIGGLGIGTVIDLRDIGERAKLPDALDGLDVRHIELPVFDDHFFPSRPMSREEMKAAAVDLIAEHCTDGVVFHCSAGKDRTGVIGAFLLDLLGVGRQEIVDEYAITSTHLSGGFLEAITRNFSDAGISGNLAQTATAAPPELINEILDRIDAEHWAASAKDEGAPGGVEAYLFAHGMDPATPARLRQCLLESASDRGRA